MAARTSKEVTDRQKSCQFVLTALLRQGIKVADQLFERVRPHLEEGEEEPGFFPVIRALARHLGASADRLVASDEALYAANVRVSRLREERSEQFSRLARLMARLRLTLLNQFVAPRLDDLGLEGETARSTVPLLRQADRIDRVFQSADLAELLGESIFEEPANIESQAAELRPIATVLRSTNEQFDEARRQFDEGLVAKIKTMAEHDQIFIRTARSFEELCRLAGEKELADRVRPSERRPGRVQQDASSQDESATDESATDRSATDESATDAAGESSDTSTAGQGKDAGPVTEPATSSDPVPATPDP